MNEPFIPANPNAPADQPARNEGSEAQAAPSVDAVRNLFALFRVSGSLEVMLELKNTSRTAPMRRHELNARLSASSERAITNALDALRSAGLVNREPLPEGIGAHYFLSSDGRRLLALVEEVCASCGRFAPLLAEATFKRKAPAATESTRPNGGSSP